MEEVPSPNTMVCAFTPLGLESDAVFLVAYSRCAVLCIAVSQGTSGRVLRLRTDRVVLGKIDRSSDTMSCGVLL